MLGLCRGTKRRGNGATRVGALDQSEPLSEQLAAEPCESGSSLDRYGPGSVGKIVNTLCSPTTHPGLVSSVFLQYTRHRMSTHSYAGLFSRKARKL